MSPLVLRLCLAGVFEHSALVLVVLGSLGELVTQGAELFEVVLFDAVVPEQVGLLGRVGFTLGHDVLLIDDER